MKNVSTSMIYPQLRCCYSIEYLDENTTLLRSEKERRVIYGEAFQKLIPLLTGRFSEDDILARLKGEMSLPEFFYALNQLKKGGFLTERIESGLEAQSAFWSLCGEDFHEVQKSLQEKRIEVFTLGNVSENSFCEAFLSLGGRIGESSVLSVWLVDEYYNPSLLGINRRNVNQKRHWMLAKPVGGIIWMGPIFIPDATGCFECLFQRIRGNRPFETFLTEREGTGLSLPVSFTASNSADQIASNLIAQEVAKWLVNPEMSRLVGTVITLDLTTLELDDHVLVRRPQCAVCGDQEYQTLLASPIHLRSCKKEVTNDGGCRMFPPEKTFERYKHHISHITGVVQYLYSERDNDLDAPIYNYQSGPNLALRSKYNFWRDEHLRSYSGGKGLSRAQAKTSALCEALERHSMVYQGYEKRVRGSLQELGEQAIHPNKCMNFSEFQYQNRKTLNYNAKKLYFRIPEPFRETHTIDWAPVWSLTRQEIRYLPMGYCYIHYPEEDDYKFCYGDSNGCSAGNSVEEAILQGFLELVERDSVGIWWFNRLRRPQVSLESFGEPVFERIQSFFLSLNRDLAVLDITFDLGIPTFAAVSRRVDQEREDLIVGFGAHLDAKVAISRALAELGQFLPIVPSPSDENAVYRTKDAAMLDWLKTARLRKQTYLVPDEATTIRTREDYSAIVSDDLRDDVLWCKQLIEDKNMEMLVLDLTRPDIGLNVVKVIVPGMRHFWNRFAPGRLYDLPVEMGLLDTPRKEGELNPIPVFF